MYLARLFLPPMVAAPFGLHDGGRFHRGFSSRSLSQHLCGYKSVRFAVRRGSWLPSLRPHGVRVFALCPGSDRHRISAGCRTGERTARSKESAEKVARVGLQALAAGKPMVISGLKNGWPWNRSGWRPDRG